MKAVFFLCFVRYITLDIVVNICTWTEDGIVHVERMAAPNQIRHSWAGSDQEICPVVSKMTGMDRQWLLCSGQRTDLKEDSVQYPGRSASRH